MNFNDAVTAWILSKRSDWNWSFPGDDISDVDFIEEHGGYCETCWYTMTEVKFNVNGQANSINLYDINLYDRFLSRVLNEILEASRDN